MGLDFVPKLPISRPERGKPQAVDLRHKNLGLKLQIELEAFLMSTDFPTSQGLDQICTHICAEE